VKPDQSLVPNSHKLFFTFKAYFRRYKWIDSLGSSIALADNIAPNDTLGRKDRLI